MVKQPFIVRDQERWEQKQTVFILMQGSICQPYGMEPSGKYIKGFLYHEKVNSWKELVDMPVATQFTLLPSSTPPLELLSLLQSLWVLAQPPCGALSAPTSPKLGTGMGLERCQGIQMITLRFTETMNCLNWPMLLDKADIVIETKCTRLNI